MFMIQYLSNYVKPSYENMVKYAQLMRTLADYIFILHFGRIERLEQASY
jgi:hypothetical protein